MCEIGKYAICKFHGSDHAPRMECSVYPNPGDDRPVRPAREWTGSVSDLPAGMRHGAAELARAANDMSIERSEYPVIMRDFVASVLEWADAVEQLYVRRDA
jgi:hypothetical protein